MRKTVSLVLFVFIFSIIIYLFIPEFSVFGISIEKLDLYSELLSPQDYFSPTVNNNTDNFPIIESENIDINNNSKEGETINSENLKAYNNDSTCLLKNFFESLKNLEDANHTKNNKDNTSIKSDSVKKVRIAFIGDSMIEGDLISQTLRYRLQKRFGGFGVGYVPITSPVAGFRRSIIHTFSNNWKTISLITMPSNKFLGLSGYVFNPNYVSKLQLKDSNIKAGLSWISLKAPDNFYDNLNHFNTIKLYYSQTDSNSYVTFDGNLTKCLSLKGDDIVNELTLNENEEIQDARIYFHCSSPVNIYGFSVESANGIFVDNYALRGNSGIPMILLNKEVLEGINKYFNYSLIIVQYGLNVVLPETKDLDWYKNQMIKVVEYLKECFPQSDIIIMSVGDKCYKKAGKYITEPSIPLMVNIQEQIAKESGVAFWNLFKEMGGENSMVKWVNNTPPFANKDYTHFNYAGAERIGIMLYNQIMHHYNNYYRN